MRVLLLPLGVVGMALFVLSGIEFSPLAPSVEANHIGGALYTGTHQGGGHMEFEVQGDGSGLNGFGAMDIPGEPSCNFGESNVAFNTPLPIQDHSFSYQVNNGLSFEGTFTAPGSAEGTLRAKRQAIPPYIPPCDSGIISWSAATNAQPTPSATASPTPTPTPTPTGAPSDTPTPSPTPTGSALIRGDVRCNGLVDLDDFLALLAYLADLSDALLPGCLYSVGEEIVAGIAWDDTDCDLDADINDVLNLILYKAGLAPVFPQCSGIGDPLPIP